MPFFEYVASDPNGELNNGEMEAVDRDTVIDFLKSENLLVVSVKEKSVNFTSGKISFGKKIGYIDKITFTGNLSIMIKAGVNLSDAIDILAADTDNNYFKRILNDIKFGIENGKPLSEGLKNYPKDFNPIFIAMIQSGEESGKLEESLSRLNSQLKKEFGLISKVKNALIYPTVLIGGVLVVWVLIVTFIIPKLVNLIAGANLKIPVTTKIVFFVAKVASWNPLITIGVVLGVIILLALLARLKSVKKLVAKILFKTPISSELMKNLELIRFCRTTGILLGSGIAIAKSLEIASANVTLPIYKKIILDAKEKIIKGVSLANAFRGTEKYFPSLLISVINVGEKTGELDKLLQSLADFYEEQADNTLKTLTSSMEPILLVIVGVLIGGMAVSIVMPIYQLIGTF